MASPVSLGSKTLLYPMPVLIIGTYNDDGTPNAMNAAWGGISNEAGSPSAWTGPTGQPSTW